MIQTPEKLTFLPRRENYQGNVWDIIRQLVPCAGTLWMDPSVYRLVNSLNGVLAVQDFSRI